MNNYEPGADDRHLPGEKARDCSRAEEKADPLSAAHRAELDRRLAASEVREPDAGDSWEAVRARLLRT